MPRPPPTAAAPSGSRRSRTVHRGTRGARATAGPRPARSTTRSAAERGNWGCARGVGAPSDRQPVNRGQSAAAPDAYIPNSKI
eukprot:365028-Chlamydomonas_euryale.AAC.52